MKLSTDNIFFYKTPSFLFALLPLTLISGPFLSDLSISIISLVFLIHCFYEKNLKPFKNIYFYTFLVFCFYLISNSLFNNQNISSLKISLFYFRFGIFVLAINELLNVDKKFLKYFFITLLVCFFILILDGYKQYFTSTNFLGWSVSYSHRVSSLFGEELILGSYVSRLWPMLAALTLFFYEKKNKLFYFHISVLFLSYILVFLSGERTAFFFVNLSVFFIIIFSNKFFKFKIFTLAILLLSLVLITAFNDKAKKRIFNETINQMNLNNNEQKYFFSKQHTHHYISAYKMFLNNRIFGVGVKNFRNLCNKEDYRISNVSCTTHPHNSYIQVLAELGLIGISFLLLVLSLFIKVIFKHLYYKMKNVNYLTNFQICILSGFLISIWPLAPSGNIFNNWLNIFYYLYVPFILNSFKDIKKT